MKTKELFRKPVNALCSLIAALGIAGCELNTKTTELLQRDGARSIYSQYEDGASEPDAASGYDGSDEDIFEGEDSRLYVDESEIQEENPERNKCNKLYFPDLDKDGYGKEGEAFVSCKYLFGHVAKRGGDCNDNDPEINPKAKEKCDGLDNDCDGNTDEQTYTPCPDGSGYVLEKCKNGERVVIGGCEE